MALNWLRQQPGTVIPIIGARKATQIADNIDAIGWKLSPEQMLRLTEASKIELGFPHDFFARDMVRGFVYGGLRDRIDG